MLSGSLPNPQQGQWRPVKKGDTGMREGYEALVQERKREGEGWKEAKTVVQRQGRNIKNWSKILRRVQQIDPFWFSSSWSQVILFCPKDLILQLKLLIILHTHPRTASVSFSLLSCERPPASSTLHSSKGQHTWPCSPITSGTSGNPLFSFLDQVLPSRAQWWSMGLIPCYGGFRPLPLETLWFLYQITPPLKHALSLTWSCSSELWHKLNW